MQSVSSSHLNMKDIEKNEKDKRIKKIKKKGIIKSNSNSN